MILAVLPGLALFEKCGTKGRSAIFCICGKTERNVIASVRLPEAMVCEVMM